MHANSMGKGINFLASGAGQLHIDMGKNELQHTPQNMNKNEFKVDYSAKYTK